MLTIFRTDYIVTYISDELRKQAKNDKVVAAAGISGGVSGFIQAVLVPELAEKLIMDDMSVTQERACEIRVESGELGDILSLEIEERVAEDVDVDVDE
jgi:hypothetical protein